MKDFSDMHTYNLEDLFQPRPKSNKRVHWKFLWSSISFYFMPSGSTKRPARSTETIFFFSGKLSVLSRGVQAYWERSAQTPRDHKSSHTRASSSSGDLLKTHDIFCVCFIFTGENRLAGSVDNPSSSLFLEKQKGHPVSRKDSGSFLGERPTNAVSCGLITSRRWALFMDRTGCVCTSQTAWKRNPH